MSFLNRVQQVAGAAVMLLGMANAADAAIVSFSDTVSGPVTLQLPGTPTYSFSHNINDSIDIGTDTILGGNLAIFLTDTGGSETTEIKFDLGPFQTLSGPVGNSIDTVNFGLSAFGLIASLQADGILNVIIKVLQQGAQPSNVIFSSSTLTGTAERPDAPVQTTSQDVPEPATILLLAGGLLGLGALRRRRLI